MLKIRLARGGAKKRPYYSIVVADSHSPRDGRFIEKVGAYDPQLAKDHPGRVTLKVERIQDWIKKGAQPTDRVARFLSKEGLVAWEHGDNPNKAKPGKKAEERAAERAQKDEDRKAAEAEALANPPPAPEPEPEAAPEPVAELAPEPVAPEPVAPEPVAPEPVAPEPVAEETGAETSAEDAPAPAEAEPAPVETEPTPSEG